PMRLRFRGGHAWVDGERTSAARHDAKMIKALRGGHNLVDGGRHYPCPIASPDSPYLRRLIRLAMLAPDIQRAILDGRQPTALTLERLTRSPVPLVWADQRS